MYNNNDKEMMPRRRRSYGAPRPLASVQNSRFDSPYVKPFAAPTSSHYTAMSGLHASFRHRLSYPHRKRPYPYSSVPTYSGDSLNSAQNSSNWHGPSRASSPYTYKNAQNMMRGRGDSSTASPNSKHHSHKSSGTLRLSGEFNVNDYVIPEMTSNPWTKLEELYANHRLDKQ